MSYALTPTFASPSSSEYRTDWTASLARRAIAGLGLREVDEWPKEYVNRRTHRVYQPHNDDERVFVYDDEPRYALLAGGWGSGKTCGAAAKTLGRLARRMNGLVVSPDLEHFKTSCWPEFRDWCPWEMVIPRQQYRQAIEWEPSKAFSLVFVNGAVLYCGGIHDASRWWGGNVHFAWFDEAARYSDASAFKTLMSRARLLGPKGEPPQVYVTTTPDMNWLYDYFGPLQDEDDPFADFKRESFVGRISTMDNLPNLDPGYVTSLSKGLSGAERLLFLDAQWVHISSVQKFVNIVWWDACREDLPALGRSEPMVLGVDAAKGGETNQADCFAVVGVTRHPARKDNTAVRYCQIWQPEPGRLMDFLPIEEEIRRLCREFAVVEIAYDPTQLHDPMMRLKREGIAHVREFQQGGARLIADNQLLDVIAARRIAHSGDSVLRKHLDNANMKREAREGIRIVKRTESLKIDAAVALSMANARSLFYNLQ